MKATTMFLSVAVIALGLVSCASRPAQASLPKDPPTNTAITMADVKKVKGDISRLGTPLRVKKHSLVEGDGQTHHYIEFLTTPPPAYGEIVGRLRGNYVLATDDPTEFVVIRGG